MKTWALFSVDRVVVRRMWRGWVVWSEDYITSQHQNMVVTAGMSKG